MPILRLRSARSAPCGPGSGRQAITAALQGEGRGGRVPSISIPLARLRSPNGRGSMFPDRGRTLLPHINHPLAIGRPGRHQVGGAAKSEPGSRSANQVEYPDVGLRISHGNRQPLAVRRNPAAAFVERAFGDSPSIFPLAVQPGEIGAEGLSSPVRTPVFRSGWRRMWYARFPNRIPQHLPRLSGPRKPHPGRIKLLRQQLRLKMIEQIAGGILAARIGVEQALVRAVG